MWRAPRTVNPSPMAVGVRLPPPGPKELTVTEDRRETLEEVLADAPWPWKERGLHEKMAALKPGESTVHRGLTLTKLGGLAESGKAPGSNPEVGDTRGGSNPPPSASTKVSSSKLS